VSGRVVCFGGLVLDRRVRSLARVVPATSNPAAAELAPGGVAANVAVGLARLGVHAALVTAVGDDDSGRVLLEHAIAGGVDVRGVRVVAGCASAQYLAFLQPDGELYVAAAAMDVLARITVEDVRRAWPVGHDDWVFAEANLSSGALAETIASARTSRGRLAVDAVSVPKAARLPADLSGIAVLFGNLDEARALVGDPGADRYGCARALRARGVSASVLTLGAEGAFVLAGDDEPIHVPGIPVRVRDVTGAGDALVAATLAGLLRGRGLAEAVGAGTLAAAALIGPQH
jgi:pseudouridine kinase